MMASFKRHLEVLDPSLMISVLPCSKKRREMMMMNNEEVVLPLINREFSELPIDVLYVIIQKLFCPSDLVWFGAVCVNWRYALIQNPDKHFKFPSSLPVLVLPSPSSSSTSSIDKEDGENITTTATGIRFSSLYEGKIHDLPLPISWNICGSSHGWLVVATGANHNYSVKLFNPFMSFNNEIQLPSATTFKIIDPNNYDDEVYLEKAVLSANPSSSNRGTGEVVVMAIHGLYSRLSYCRPGDNAWTALPFKWIKKVHDVIYFKGLFYAILRKGLVFTIEIPVANHLDITPKINVITNHVPSPRVAEYSIGGSHYFTDNFLVESSGEILQVIMKKMLIREDCSIHYRTLGFHIFKLAKADGHDQSNCSKTTNCNNNEKYLWVEETWSCSKTTNCNNNEKYLWAKTWSLDGSSLFISHNVSISLSASDFPGCKPNCIYFAENYGQQGLGSRHLVGTNNIEIYDVEDMVFHEKPTSSHLAQYGFSQPCSNPIWIQPTM